MADLKQEITSEIEALHRFISAWFRGETEQQPGEFQSGFSNRLSENFINIQPSGEILSKADLGDPIYAAYGNNPSFHIEIVDVEIRNVSGDQGLILATYTELQSGAKNTNPSDNARRSSVWFQKNPDTESLIWLHVHETAMPMP